MVNSKNKLIAFFSLVVVFYLSCILVGPRVQYEHNGVKPINVYFSRSFGVSFGVSLDCDAPEFMDCANHPEYLLKDNSVRQSRPGMIFLAHIVSFTTKPIANNLMKSIKPQAPTTTSDPRYEKASNEFPATYMAYIIINFGLVLLALFIWIHLLGKNPCSIALPLSLLAFLNPVVKMFFFMPHVQMFNILVPIATYWITTESFKENFVFKKSTYWIIAALGFGLLCYGTFLIPAVLFGFISIVAGYKNNKTTFFKTLIRLCIHGVIFSAPFVLWSIYVISLKGKIYFHEAELCRQFVWIKDLVTEQGLIPMVKKYLELLWQTQVSGAEFFPITFVLLFVSYVLCEKNIFLKQLKTGAFLSLVNWLFIGGMGFYPWRIVFTIHLPLWIACSMSLNTLKNVKKELVIATYLLILSYGAYVAIMPAAF